MGVKKRYKPVVLLILDGWGIAPPSKGNAITQADTPVMDSLKLNDFYVTIQACGEGVGLAWGEKGNSEVGHMNIGAGRIVFQDLPKITNSIRDGSFYKNRAFLDAIEHVKKNNSSLHLMGLVSDGGVHSYNEHLYALLELAKTHGLKKVYIHAFLDGRDTPPKSAEKYIKELEDKIKEIGIGKIATLGGRFYGMDRDKRWDRIEKAYKAMVFGEGPVYSSALEAIEDSYKKDITDEKVEPVVLLEEGKPIGKVFNNDSVIFFNFRPDRARQITQVFVQENFGDFDRDKKLDNLLFITMTKYGETLPVEIAFKPQQVKNTLASVISKAGMKQLHIAETEKYAHMTYFLNGGRAELFSGEEHVLIRSAGVADYSTKPEMSTPEIAERIIGEISKNKYDFIVTNFANLDMVGHTGNLQATIKAAKAVDSYVKKVKEAIFSTGGVLVITADHGNGEELLDPYTGAPRKDHTKNPVPFIVASKDIEESGKYKNKLLSEISEAPQGVLCDIAPTVLALLNLPKPKEMTGNNLLV